MEANGYECGVVTQCVFTPYDSFQIEFRDKRRIALEWIQGVYVTTFHNEMVQPNNVASEAATSVSKNITF